MARHFTGEFTQLRTVEISGRATVVRRYWTQDINSLNSHFGTEDDLKALSLALHNRSMYLMVDVVVNHMVSSSDPPDYSSFAPFSDQSQFHDECFISDWNNQTEVEQCWLGDTNVPLADLNTEDDEVVKALNAWIHDLAHEYRIDGVRIDTVKHIRRDFWPDFAASAGVFTLGEISQNDTSYVAPYTGKLSVLSIHCGGDSSIASRRGHRQCARLSHLVHFGDRVPELCRKPHGTRGERVGGSGVLQEWGDDDGLVLGESRPAALPIAHE